MRKYLYTYEEAVSHIWFFTAPFWISLYCIWGKFCFLFIRVLKRKYGMLSSWNRACLILLMYPISHWENKSCHIQKFENIPGNRLLKFTYILWREVSTGGSIVTVDHSYRSARSVTGTSQLQRSEELQTTSRFLSSMPIVQRTAQWYVLSLR